MFEYLTPLQRSKVVVATARGRRGSVDAARVCVGWLPPGGIIANYSRAIKRKLHRQHVPPRMQYCTDPLAGFATENNCRWTPVGRSVGVHSYYETEPASNLLWENCLLFFPSSPQWGPRTMTSPVCADVRAIPEQHLSRYQRVEYLRPYFWTRWIREYISATQMRSKLRENITNHESNTLVD
ncbi:hypothetical protein K1T71_002375 [Dendrolimus kikuchii]|uniref:Uncharacterized protein n=1 Tax=Dendrolimus kikuchii TaxID=765133 RepID=A0ACC1DCJ0_9NEOP|nr:hypothetical protein K1T71_002375 [Dendrolimus kikuchii]